MKVDLRLIEGYLLTLTESSVAAQGDPLERIADMNSAIDEMAEAARANGDDDLLRLVIDALAARPQGRLDQFNGEYYVWSEDELTELLAYAHDRIWPDMLRSLPGEEMEIEFEDSPAI